MNETKIKTVSEERDEAIWLMNKTSLELNRTKAQLAATEEALQQVQRESAELREDRDLNRQRVIELQRESLELRTERDNTLDGVRTAAILLHVSVHYAATGVRWEECEDCKDVRILLPEYRPIAEPSDVDEKEDGLGFFPGFPPGFDVKRAEKGLAQDGCDLGMACPEARDAQAKRLG